MLLSKRPASQVVDAVFSDDLAEEMADFAIRTQSCFKYNCISKKIICSTSNKFINWQSLPSDLISDQTIKVSMNKNHRDEDITRQQFSRSMPHIFTPKIIELITKTLYKNQCSPELGSYQKSLTPANLRKKMVEDEYLKPDGRRMMKENPKLTKKFSNLVNKIKNKHFKSFENSEDSRNTSISPDSASFDESQDTKETENHHKEKILVDKFYAALASRLSKTYTQRMIFGGNMEFYDRSFLG